MDIERMRELENYLRIEPRRFDMEHWVSPVDERGRLEESSENDLAPSFIPPCGTVACLAGSVGIMTGAAQKDGKWYYAPFGYSWFNYAKEYLDLSSQQAEALFALEELHGGGSFGTFWPKEFEQCYFDAKTPEERVQVAIDRIEHMIATGE